MKRTELFCHSNKQDVSRAETVSHQLLLRADFIDQLASGIYSFLPLGWKVYQKIAGIIREELNQLGGQELLMPSLQPKALWQESGRWGKMDPPLFTLEDCHHHSLCLASTHEEAITDLVRSRIASYKDLPLALYQIQTKFRNETRATGGLLRTKEFQMMDLYSFHQDESNLVSFYGKVQKAYENIFQRMNLKMFWVSASSGTIGGRISHEAVVLAKSGEDKVFVCPQCGNLISEEAGQKVCPQCHQKMETREAIEVGHVFQLGTKYSQAMNAHFADKKGQSHFIEMGCYGLGLSRIMATVVEAHHDAQGMIWPSSVAPFLIYLMGVEKDAEVEKIVASVYNRLQKKGRDVLWDDRIEKSAGEKFAEADLIGIPYRLVVSKKTLSQQKIEIKARASNQSQLIALDKLEDFFDKNV